MNNDINSLTWAGLSAGQRAIVQAVFGMDICTSASKTKNGQYPLHKALQYEISRHPEKLTDQVMLNLVCAILQKEPAYVKQIPKADLPKVSLWRGRLFDTLIQSGFLFLMVVGICLSFIWCKVVLFTPYEYFLASEDLVISMTLRIATGAFITWISVWGARLAPRMGDWKNFSFKRK